MTAAAVAAPLALKAVRVDAEREVQIGPAVTAEENAPASPSSVEDPDIGVTDSRDRRGNIGLAPDGDGQSIDAEGETPDSTDDETTTTVADETTTTTVLETTTTTEEAPSSTVGSIGPSTTDTTAPSPSTTEDPSSTTTLDTTTTVDTSTSTTESTTSSTIEDPEATTSSTEAPPQPQPPTG